MKAKIWMPLFIGDYLADTQHLTAEQHGAYLLLLMHQWKTGPLPNNNELLARVGRLTPDAWSIAQAVLRPFFTLNDDGMLFQQRLKYEKERATANSTSARAKAKRAAEARWGNDASSMSQALLDSCPSPSPSPSPIKQPTGAGAPRVLQLKVVEEKPKKQPSLSEAGAENILSLYIPERVSEAKRAVIVRHIQRAHAALMAGKVGNLPKMCDEEAERFLTEQTKAYMLAVEDAGTELRFIKLASNFYAEHFFACLEEWPRSERSKLRSATIVPKMSAADKIRAQERSAS